MSAHAGAQAVSPYGRTKLIIEDMFRDLFAAEKDWRIILLRYFNPVGAHPSGEQLSLSPQFVPAVTLAWQPRARSGNQQLAVHELGRSSLLLLQARLGSTQWASPTT